MPEHPLRAWLYGQRITQEEFAEKVGLRNRSMLSLLFTGRRKPSEALARRISRATGKQVTIEQLLGFEVPKNVRPRRRRSPTEFASRKLSEGEQIH